MERYCLHNKYVPQRMGPTPSQARRVDGKSAFREASSIKEETGNIRCEGWNYRSLHQVKSIIVAIWFKWRRTYESDSVINRMGQGESC